MCDGGAALSRQTFAVEMAVNVSLTRAAVVVALSWTLMACSADSGAATPATEAATDLPARSGADAYRQLQDYVALALHRTGTDGGEKLIGWLDQRLHGFGLTPRIERFDFKQFTPRKAQLVNDAGTPIASFPYWYSGRTGADGVKAELVDVGRGDEAAFRGKTLNGKLVLADIQLLYRALFSNLNEVMQRAYAAGAVGVVAAVQAPRNLIAAANAESEAGLCGLPVLFVGAEDGRALRARSGQNFSFTLDADYGEGESANVVVTIPGQSRDTLIVGTPVNGWFSTASERGSGVGSLLTLARHYAARFASKPPAKTLVFLFTGGHEVGFLGLQRYIDAHPDVLADTYAYVHLGASVAGAYYFEKPDGSIASAPIADPARTLYVSENPPLQQLVSARQLQSGLLPAQSVLPSVSNPGEQRRMYARGVPIVSISGTTLFFHTEADTPDTTSAELLEPAVRFYGSVIDDLLATDAASLRANNRVAAAHAKPLPVPACVVPGG